MSSSASAEPKRADSSNKQNSSSATALHTVVYSAHSPDEGISQPIDVSTGIGCVAPPTVAAILKSVR